MKKIMIAAAAVMLGIAANAAAVGWQCAGATAYAGGTYGVYVIGLNGVESVDQIVALAKDGKDLGAYQFGSGTVAANGSAMTGAAASGKTITYSGTGTDTYTAFAVIFNADGKTGSYTATTNIEMANDSQSKTFLLGNQATNLANNQFEVAPEPTSGLLLLLGVTGLALRRRRA